MLRIVVQHGPSWMIHLRNVFPFARFFCSPFLPMFIFPFDQWIETRSDWYCCYFLTETSHLFSDSNTQSSDIYTLSTNSGSENSKASSSDTSPALRNSGNQSRLSTSSRPTSERNLNQKCVSDGSVSPLGHSSYSGTTAGDVCADNHTVINLGMFICFAIMFGQHFSGIPNIFG